MLIPNIRKCTSDQFVQRVNVCGSLVSRRFRQKRPGRLRDSDRFPSSGTEGQSYSVSQATP